MAERSVIVVPVDNAGNADRTVHHAVGIARRRGADVHALQVVPRDAPPWRVLGGTSAWISQLETARAAAERDGVGVRLVTVPGVPERVVPAYAQLIGASLIVVERHYGSSRLWGTSATASRLIRSSPVPVLVTATGDTAVEARAARRIVAAVDFTVASAIALRTAAELSRRNGARLSLVHAMTAPDHMVFSAGEARAITQRLPAHARQRAARLAQKAATVGAGEAAPVVVTGEASRAILDTAAATAADLIVMGAAPRTWIDDVMSGSTLRRVLRRATVPVLVLPVVGGAHEWLDLVDGDHVSTPAEADGAAPRAA